MRVGIILAILLAFSAAMAVAVLPWTYSCVHLWRQTDSACIWLEIVHRWQTLLAGGFALVAAGVSVAFLSKQVRQAERHNREAISRDLKAIAATIQIDVLETSHRLDGQLYLRDLEPAMSATAERLLHDATRVDPALAIALSRHLLEVRQFTQGYRELVANGLTMDGNLPAGHDSIRNELVYRAHVISHCFAVAWEKTDKIGVPKGPYIDRSDLEELERRYRVFPKERRYLEHLFEVTGLG